MVNSSSGERLRPLGLMRVVGAGVDLQLAELLDAEPVPRKHALDGTPDDLLGTAIEEVTEGWPLWRMYSFVSRLLLVTAIRDALRTMTWSPESRFGDQVGLCLPSSTRAIRDERRPSVSSAASTTYQRRSISLARTV
jgi:hypothetical protein